MISSNANPVVTIDDILDYKTELEILEFYLDINSLPVMICSPLRPDRSPSLRIDFNENGLIRFYDFGGSNQNGGLFDLLMGIYGLSFQDIIIKIYNEIISGKPLIKIKRDKLIQQKNNVSRIESLNIKVRPIRSYDLEFWGTGGIDESWLNFGDVYPISHMFIKKDGKEMIIPAERYAYAYLEYKDGIQTYKIYQPFSEKYKWINNHDRSVWDLWTKLPEFGENIIITKSRKDALTIWANTGIPATCLQAESMQFKNHVAEQIDERFKNKFILYDNDWNKSENYGRIFGDKVSRLLGFKQIEIPSEFECTDSFELRSKVGKELFIEIIKGLIK